MSQNGKQVQVGRLGKFNFRQRRAIKHRQSRLSRQLYSSTNFHLLFPPSSAIMRIASTLVLSSIAGLLPFASAHTPTRSLARLNHHQHRSIVDLCVSIPNIAVSLLHLLGANVELCLCLKDLSDLYLQTTDNVTLGGNALAEVVALLGDPKNNPTCGPLPPHAHRACTNANPCHYACDPGFTDNGNGGCACAAPNVICNNECGPATAGCGASAIARSLKSRGPITTFEAAQRRCGPTKAVCGVVNSIRGSLAFECVDVTSDSESCGGCVTPHPFLPPSGVLGGIDCRRLSSPHTCENSQCVAQSSRRALVSTSGPITADGTLLNGIITLGSSAPSASAPMPDPSLSSALAGMVAAASVIKISTAALPVTAAVNASAVIAPMLAVNVVLGSTTANFPGNVDGAVAAVQTLQEAINGCGCAGDLGGLVHGVVDLLHNLLDLQKACSGGATPTVSGPGSCLDVDASKLLCNLLGPEIQVGPLAVCLLGLELGELQPLVDGLGLNAACASGPDVAPPSAPPVSPPQTSVDPADPNIVIKFADIVIKLALTLNFAATHTPAGPSAPCHGVVGSLNTLVQSILGEPLLGPGALIDLGNLLSKRGLLSGLLGGDTSPVALGGLTPTLSGVTNNLTPAIGGVLALVNGAGSTCNIGGVGGLLNQLLAAVNKLLGGVGGLQGCGCLDHITSAVADMQRSALASLPAATTPTTRAFRTRSRRGHVNFLPSEPDSATAPDSTD
ncbi:hypothetical protein B0H15DRAFT_457400 [Mycena belliarum]|uniref:Protein CPL1-like domain-containing protein n=1 Tax=Mycena belliarum TaxID=1033014 RepID=A0AAD6XSQ5_9AGAR|nr:hypothetical protein B0H15DRAFT_457400 [Mycena belliae]